MSYDYEKLLHEALNPSQNPDEKLIKEVKHEILEKKPSKAKWSKYQSIAAVLAGCVILAGTTTIVNAATNNQLLSDMKSFFFTCFNTNGEPKDIHYYTDSQGNVMFSFTLDNDEQYQCPIVYKCGKRISSSVVYQDSDDETNNCETSVMGCIGGIKDSEIEDSHTYTFHFKAGDNDYSFISIIPSYYSDEDVVWELRQLFYETMPDNKDREEHLKEYKKLKKNCKDSLVEKAVSQAIDDLDSDKQLCIDSIPIYKERSNDDVNACTPQEVDDLAWICVDLNTLQFENGHATTTVDSAAGYEGTFKISVFKDSETGEYSILKLSEIK